MDLQTRKLNLISYISQLQDEHFFDNIEEYILSKLEKKDYSEFALFSVENLISRIEKSEDDFKNARFKTHEDLENLSANW